MKQNNTQAQDQEDADQGRETAERLAGEMAIIAEIGRVISSTLNIEAVYERFAAEVKKLIPFDVAVVNLKNQSEDTLTLTYVSGVDIPGRRAGDTIVVPGSVSEIVMTTRKSLLLLPASLDEVKARFPAPTAALSLRAGMQSGMAIPLIFQDAVVGTLHFRAKNANAYGERDLRLAEKIGRQIAGAIANAQLYANLKRTEASLRESDNRYRALFDQVAVGVAEVETATGRFLTVNRRLCEILGMTGDEMLATTFRAITHPEDLQLHLEKTELLMSGKIDNFTLEKRYVRKDGEVIWVSVTVSPLWKPGEAPGHNIAVVQDITERKHAEERQRRSQETAERLARELAGIAEIGWVISSTLNIGAVYERFATEARKLIPFDRVAVYLKNADGKTLTTTYVSGVDIAERRPGDVYSIEGSFSGIVFKTRKSLLMPPACFEEMTDRYPGISTSLSIRGGMISGMVVPLIAQDAVIGSLHFRSKKRNAYNDNDLRVAERIATQIAGAIANARLFAELKKIEKSLRENEEMYTRLIAAVPDAVVILDLDGRICLANEVALRLSGFSSGAELLGKNILEFVAPEDLEKAEKNMVLMLEGRLPPQEYHVISRDGSRTIVEINGDVLKNADGSPFGSVQVCRDISDRKKLEEELKNTLDSLESQVRERTMELEETNTALRVLLKKGNEEQKSLGENLHSNIHKLIMPCLRQLRMTQSDSQSLHCLDLVESNLDDILSPFINHLSASFKNLTPKEVQIAELIRQGKASKEISEVLGISVATTNTHRNNIRKKLNLKKKRTNLRSHLLSLA